MVEIVSTHLVGNLIALLLVRDRPGQSSGQLKQVNKTGGVGGGGGRELMRHLATSTYTLGALLRSTSLHASINSGKSEGLSGNISLRVIQRVIRLS